MKMECSFSGMWTRCRFLQCQYFDLGARAAMASSVDSSGMS